jgi:hypothetical protein
MVSSKTAEEAISPQTLLTTDTIPVESHETPNPNDVFWDSDDDQSNPKNWSVVRRWTHVVIIALVTFITYVPGPSPYISGPGLMFLH